MAKAPPRATPAMAMTAVRNGSCSVKIDVAPPALDVGEAPVPVPVPVLEAAEDEVPHSWFLS